MHGALFLLPLFYFAAVLAVVSVVIVALWRIMKAQQVAAQALEQIAYMLAQRPEPPA